MIELLDALSEAREVWRRVERAAAEYADLELEARVIITRQSILDVRELAEELAFALEVSA